MMYILVGLCSSDTSQFELSIIAYPKRKFHRDEA